MAGISFAKFVGMEQKEKLTKLQDLIKDMKFAMLTTIEEDGALRSRPMATTSDITDGSLWFFTKASAPKVAEVQRSDKVNVSYAHPDDNCYVSVSGSAHLVRDKDKIKDLWNPLFKAWFPKGIDDPEIALLRVDIDHAEYWDSSSSAMVHLYGVVKASLTGQPARTEEVGEHEKLDLTG